MTPISLDSTNSIGYSWVKCTTSCFKDVIAVQDLLDALKTDNRDKICNTKKDCEKKKSIRIATSTAANVRYIGCYSKHTTIRTIELVPGRGKEGSIQASAKCQGGGNEISLNYTGNIPRFLIENLY